MRAGRLPGVGVTRGRLPAVGATASALPAPGVTAGHAPSVGVSAGRLPTVGDSRGMLPEVPRDSLSSILDLSGVGGLSLASSGGSIIQDAVLDLAGVGGLGLVAREEHAAELPLAGSGGLGWSSDLAQSATLTLSGSGTLSGSVSEVHPAGLNLAGSGFAQFQSSISLPVEFVGAGVGSGSTAYTPYVHLDGHSQVVAIVTGTSPTATMVGSVAGRYAMNNVGSYSGATFFAVGNPSSSPTTGYSAGEYRIEVTGGSGTKTVAAAFYRSRVRLARTPTTRFSVQSGAPSVTVAPAPLLSVGMFIINWDDTVARVSQSVATSNWAAITDSPTSTVGLDPGYTGMQWFGVGLSLTEYAS